MNAAKAYELIEIDPTRLVAAIRGGEISPGHLTHVAEAMGRNSTDETREALFELLTHERPIVREGAIYGLIGALGEDGVRARLLDRLREMAASDPSPAIRDVALSEIDWVDSP